MILRSDILPTLGGATLIAVSKTQPIETILPLIEQGQRHFGENRVQEAAAKFPALKQHYPDLKLHLIGALQTNKVSQAVDLFDYIEVIDRPALASALAKACRARTKWPIFYIQVNIGCETQKSGILPEKLGDLLQFCKNEGLRIDGLMAIPPQGQPARPFFRALADLAKKNDLANLSMGMSGDYQEALLEGATAVRLGTALFGSR